MQDLWWIRVMDSTIGLMLRKLPDPVRQCYLGNWWSFVIGVGSYNNEGNEIQTYVGEEIRSIKQTMSASVLLLIACSLLTYILSQNIIWRSTIILELGERKWDVKKKNGEKQSSEWAKKLSCTHIMRPGYIQFKCTGRNPQWINSDKLCNCN